MTSRYEALSHTADTGIVAYGATVAEVFENAAFGMFDLMFGIDDRVGGVRVLIETAAPTVEDLLVDWLSALLFEAETNDVAFGWFEVEVLEGGRLTGWASGVPSAGLELSGPPIKAVTYHELALEKTRTGWSARVVFDV